ncbi:glycosyltransferase [Pontixanthobacter gangjinensis]|uniref:Glycosyltransferase n=1 Tax=Christiangramia aestuarii TaxID=1028746 RepID=A0A7M3SWT1_9FLAO|nr:glycosyltransferase [Christiangramia aestuarii]MUP41062.1 glycosyltransferase [Christiangramia aestuarii]
MISIIIATYNCVDSISETINSVINQNSNNWELIIIDDGSSDNTDILIKRTFSQNNIRYYYQDNKGVSAARNYGVEVASGEYIMFLDADDKLFDNAIKDFSDLINSENETGIVSGAYMYSGKRKIYPRVKGALTQFYTLNTLVGSFIVNRNLFINAGGYDTNLTFSENFELFIRLTKLCKENKISIKSGKFLTFEYNHNSEDQKELLREKKKIETYKYLFKKYKNYRVKDYDFPLRSAETVAMSYFRLGKKKKALKWQKRAIKEAPMNLKTYLKFLRYLACK